MNFWQKILALFGISPVPKLFLVPNPEPETKMLTISHNGLELIKEFEGCQLKAYQDSVGVWTIGWGRIVYDNGSPVKQGDSCDQAAADRWLLEDIEQEGSHFVRAWRSQASQEQFDALSSFTYNRGAGRLRELLAMPGAIHDNMLAFDFAGSEHKHLPGLLRRRWAERAVYLGRDWSAFKGSDWRRFAKL